MSIVPRRSFLIGAALIGLGLAAPEPGIAAEPGTSQIAAATPAIPPGVARV